MRYRLRTLLIVVTIVGVYLARVGNLIHKAHFHRSEAESIARRISLVEGDSALEVEVAVQRLAAGHPSPNDKFDHLAVVPFLDMDCMSGACIQLPRVTGVSRFGTARWQANTIAINSVYVQAKSQSRPLFRV